jgi:hypothetical protein
MKFSLYIETALFVMKDLISLINFNRCKLRYFINFFTMRNMFELRIHIDFLLIKNIVRVRFY